MDDKEIKELFDLTGYQTKVLIVLLNEKTNLGMKEIAKLSGVSRARVYDTCKSLEKLGLIEFSEIKYIQGVGHPRHFSYKAFSLDKMVKNRIGRIKQESLNKIQMLKKLKRECKK